MNNSLTKFEIKYLIASTSIIFTEFYYFYWGSRALISDKYLIYNTIFLFVFSLLFFLLFFYFFFNLKEKNFNKKLKYIFIIYLTFTYFKIFQIPFFYANFSSLKSIFAIFFKAILSEKNFFLIPFLKIIVPFGMIYTLIVIFFTKQLNVILRFIYSFSLIFLIFMIWDVSKRIYHYEKIELKNNEINTNRKVLWFILDEYDPVYFVKNNFNLKLNNITELTEKSLIHNKSYSPSNATLNSTTSILMQTKTSGSTIKDYKFIVLNEKNDQINFDFKNTFFDKLLKNNMNFKIFSEVIPYCSMLNIETLCAKNFNQIKYYFDGIKYTYIPIEYLKKLKNFNSKKKLEQFNLSKLNSFDSYKKSDIFLSKKLNIKTNSLKNILKEENNLFFFHFFIPHTKTVMSKPIQKFFNMKPNNDDQEYMMNLKYTDLVIKEILNAIENDNNQDILLLLTSDHWRRSRSPSKPEPSLFIAKIKNQDLKVSVNQKNLNIFIPDLILKYLDKEINTHDDMNHFFKGLPIFSEKEIYIYGQKSRDVLGMFAAENF